jgi:hypothetical protein
MHEISYRKSRSSGYTLFLTRESLLSEIHDTGNLEICTKLDLD